MSQMISYQNLLSETITDFVINKKLSVEAIMTQVFESIMQAEREVFLQEAPDNKGNGYYSRFINHFQGKLALHIPRDRQGHFHPLMLEVLHQDSARMQDLALALYSQGVSHRGVKSIFSSIFQTKISPSKVSQLVKAFEPHRMRWQTRPLEERYPVILVDALHQSVRRGSVAKEALYIVMGLKADFTREILGIYQLPQETAAGWSEVFKDLTNRGVQAVGLVLCDELSGIEQAIEKDLPHVHLQLCLVHKIRRLLLRVRHQDKAALVSDWRAVLRMEDSGHTPEQFHEKLSELIQKWQKKYPSIKNQLPESKWHYYSAYLHYPLGVRRMLYTTNWIERFNKEIRKVTRHVNSFPNADAALNLVFMVAKQMEEKTYAKPITSFYPYRQTLEEIFNV